jgi:hypothetical protein
MADIRINALTEASASVTTDFLPIDGSTGTRKLSAYSPSFGGNATVGGTLTVTGNATVGGANVTQGALASLPAGAYFSAETSSGEGYLTSYNGTSAAYLPINYRSSEHKFTSNGVVKVQSTTASTTTSSGALVVGNGTSGGLGVGGAIYCGSLNATADSKISSAAAKTSSADTLKIATATGGSSDFELLISRSAAGSGAYYSIQSVEQATGYRGLALQKDGGNVLIGGTTDISGNGGLKVFGTTASTGTSSGALVVSGGVGVAGAIYAGAAITSNYSSAANTGFSVINTNSAGSPGLYLEGDAGEYAIIRRGGSTYANPRTLEYVATGSGAKHLFNTTAQFDGTVIAAASSNAFRITTAQTPASAGATGTAGTICWDTSYIYVCTATNTWKRVAIATW